MESEETPLSLGERLQKRRQERGLSLQEIAQRTRIRQAYLEAIEQGRYEALPGATYLTGFVRIFATELKLDVEELLALLPQKNSEPVDSPLFQKAEPLQTAPRRRRGGAGTPVLITAGLLILLCFSFLIWWLTSSDTSVPVTYENEVTVSQSAAETEPTVSGTPLPAVDDTSAMTSSASTERLATVDAGGETPEGVLTSPSVVVIPAKGGILELESNGISHVSLEIDGRPRRAYDLQNGALLRWKIRSSLLLKVDAAEKVRVRFEGEELSLDEGGRLHLGGAKAP
ncbi:MAG: hypothetical protein C0621_04540 [Desulfuromonas sp.]|nr:MAG: hypothetical protein C0621_04540 [Desulfuromonas sp.]